jgi:hypothetical protein
MKNDGIWRNLPTPSHLEAMLERPTRAIGVDEIRREAIALAAESRAAEAREWKAQEEQKRLHLNRKFTEHLYDLLGWGPPAEGEAYDNPWIVLDGILFTLAESQPNSYLYPLNATVPCTTEWAEAHGGHDVLLPPFSTLTELGYALSPLYCQTCAEQPEYS